MMKATTDTRKHLLFIIQLYFYNILSMTIEGEWELWEEKLPFHFVLMFVFIILLLWIHHSIMHKISIYKLPLFVDRFNYDGTREMCVHTIRKSAECDELFRLFYMIRKFKWIFVLLIMHVIVTDGLSNNNL